MPPIGGCVLGPLLNSLNCRKATEVSGVVETKQGFDASIGPVALLFRLEMIGLLFLQPNTRYLVPASSPNHTRLSAGTGVHE